MSGFPNSKAYPWALTGVFAALHLVITLIPFSLAFGGGEISFGLISAPIVGFLLGPVFGTLAVIIGSILAMSIDINIAVLGPFTVIATAAGALSAGMIRCKKPAAVPLIYLIVIPVYLMSPIGAIVPEFVWFHVVGLLLSLIFLIPKVSTKLLDAMDLATKSKYVSGIFAIWLLSIVSVTLDQLVGSALAGYYFVAVGADVGFIATFFTMSLFVYPIERMIGSFIVTAVLFALGKVLVNSNLGIPITELNPLKLEDPTIDDLEDDYT
ncbi:MAG: hypothetical protein ACTSUO_08725 [Candidatus Thorarchaeota archaeon]